MIKYINTSAINKTSFCPHLRHIQSFIIIEIGANLDKNIFESRLRNSINYTYLYLPTYTYL